MSPLFLPVKTPPSGFIKRLRLVPALCVEFLRRTSGPRLPFRAGGNKLAKSGTRWGDWQAANLASPDERPVTDQMIWRGRRGWQGKFPGWGLRSRGSAWLLVAALVAISGPGLNAQQDEGSISDLTGKYHFISADDTLGLLDEEGKLKGYVDVYQGEEESDEILSYQIVQGSRKKNRVEFRTNKIHRKYYRFSGTVERGAGRAEGDPDYLRLVGDLEIVTIKGDSGEEIVQRVRTILKSFGKGEGGEE